MYLDTDIILALIKKEDWLKKYVKISNYKPAKTSLLTIIEVRLVLSREYSREEMLNLSKKVKYLDIEFIPINEKVMEKSQELIEKYTDLGIFDSVHAASAIINNEKIVGTDSIYDKITEVENIDPREFHNSEESE